MNVRFEYLYRDAGNFKKWGEVVFSNPQNISLETINKAVSNTLIDKTYFIASKAAIPDLHFSEYDENLDHGWHEFHDFQLTDDPPTDSKERDIENSSNHCNMRHKLNFMT